MFLEPCLPLDYFTIFQKLEQTFLIWSCLLCSAFLRLRQHAAWGKSLQERRRVWRLTFYKHTRPIPPRHRQVYQMHLDERRTQTSNDYSTWPALNGSVLPHASCRGRDTLYIIVLCCCHCGGGVFIRFQSSINTSLEIYEGRTLCEEKNRARRATSFPVLQQALWPQTTSTAQLRCMCLQFPPTDSYELSFSSQNQFLFIFLLLFFFNYHHL